MSLFCFRYYQHRRGFWQLVGLGKRQFSVKELPWCAPKSSPNRKTGMTPIKRSNQGEKPLPQTPAPIPEFGIVAAMSENRVIGLNGSIPWPRCAEDRQNFKNLTKDGILIIGRSTYEEEPTQKHINHTRECIVLSKTLSEGRLAKTNVGAPETRLQVATSLPEALGLANEAIVEQEALDTSGINRIHCWVAGGERIFEEALQHKSAKEVHLTTMHLEIDVEKARKEADQSGEVGFAMFPAKHRWDRHFRKVSRVEGGGPTPVNSDSPHFTYITYVRKEL